MTYYRQAGARYIYNVKRKKDILVFIIFLFLQMSILIFIATL